MTKTRGFLLAAGISLALAFTLSCSDDGGGGNGGSAPPVPSTTSDGYQTYKVEGAQVYRENKAEGKILPYEKSESVKLYETTIQIGTISDGKLTLELKKENFDTEESYSKQWLSSSGGCDLTLLGSPNGISNATRDDLVYVSFFYVSEEVPPEGKDFTDDDFGTLKLKKGWNFVYEKDRTSTVEQPSGLTWEWLIGC